MQFPQLTMSIALIILSNQAVMAAPVPQGAGVGAGCDSILTDGDTGSGLALKYGLTNAASLLKSAGAKRQGAGFGDACNALLTEADSGSGLAVKEGLTNTANLLKGAGAKRQLDKAGAGTAAIISLVNPQTATTQEGLTNYVDGVGTSDSAAIGESLAAQELSLGTSLGNAIPKSKRQLDKVGAGTAALIGLASPDAAAYQEGLTNNIDGYGTSDSALVGQQIGALEVEAGTGLGNLVPSKLPSSGGT